MLKKLILASLSVFLLGNFAFAGNADTESDRLTIDANYSLDISTYAYRVSSGGHITNHSRVGELGSPTANWLKLYLADNGMITLGGVARHLESFVDLPAKDHDIIFAGAFISTTTLVAGGTTYVTSDFTQSPVPRNIVILATVATGSTGQTTMTVTGTCYVEGINSVGISTNEYISLVSTSNATAGLGNIAWASISSITISNITIGLGTPDATVAIFIGTNDDIGLANDIAATGDIYHVDEAGAVTTTYVEDATYNTINFATDGTGTNDYNVRYIQTYFTPQP